jgi:carbonic anhydrase/acetyltransferase-like protein (isoleucine patch superfamily)
LRVEKEYLMPLVPYLGTLPTVGEDVEIDAEGFVIGKVTLGRGVRVGARTVLRGDQDTITVGDYARFGQAISVHMDPEYPTQIGSEVVVEDDAIVHGTVLGDAVLVERDATVLTGSSVGEGSIVQAGALVPEGKAFPARSVIAGTPGKVIRETTDDEVAATRRRARERP